MMNKALSIVPILLTITGASIAQEGVMVQQPPARYDHAFNGKLVEHKVELTKAKHLCKQRGLPNTDACSWWANGTCEIVIPTNGPVRALWQYRKHEIAHCNGWPANHSG